MNKQFKFTSHSALSFSVSVHGRQTYINFSPAYRGLSYFITTDELVAEKVRAHRWFREGRIKESVEELIPAKKEHPYIQAPMPEKKKYSILGKTMAAPKSVNPQRQDMEEDRVVKEEPTVEGTTDNAENGVSSFVAEDVTSFMEAKEFFITNFGIQRSEMPTKEAVSALCGQYNVVFPNYPL